MIDSILGIILATGGALLFVHVIRCRQRIQESAHWRLVPGQIQHASIRQFRSFFGFEWHRPRVVYDYAVDGRRFRSDVVLLGGELDVPLRSWASEHTRSYVETCRVGVWIDPSNPYEACLERRSEHLLLVGALASAYFILGAALLSLSF